MLTDAEVLGDELRKAREAKEITLDKAEQQTRIRVKFLEALEQGNYSALPTAVQARGFLRNYARYLGLDDDNAVDRFDEIQAGGKRRKKPAKPSKQFETPTSDPRQNINQRSAPYIPPPVSNAAASPRQTSRQAKQGGNRFAVLAIGGIAILVIAGVGYLGYLGYQNFTAQQGRNGVILSPIPSTQGNSVLQPDMSPTPLRPTPLPRPTDSTTPTPDAKAANPGGTVAVNLQIISRTWLRVIVDEQVQYMGVPAPGTVLQYSGTAIKVRIADGAGVQAVVNGKDMGILGNRGEIVDEVFTPSGVSHATATPGQAGQPPGLAPTENASGAFNPSSTTEQTTEQVSNTSPGATFSFTASFTAVVVTATATATPTIPTATPTEGRSNVLPTYPPTATNTATPRPSATPRPTLTPSITLTPSNTKPPTATFTPSTTLTPTMTFTPSVTPTATNTFFFLPHETSTPETGQIRHK